MSIKGNAIPDSDQMARPKHNQSDDQDTTADNAIGQTSGKSGKHSSAEKLAASRPEFGESSTHHAAHGASGSGDENNSDVTRDENPPDKALKSK